MARLLLAWLALDVAFVAWRWWRAARRWREWDRDRLSDTWTTDAETWASGRDCYLDWLAEGRG